MKKTLLLLTVSISSFYFSQNIKAITDDGKEVVLLSDKTWKFVNESDENALKTLKENPAIFSKDKSVTFLVRSKKLNSGVYINPKKWALKSAEEGVLEYRLLNRDGNGYALFGSEKTSVANYEIYKNLKLATISKTSDFFKLIDSDVRIVNGRKVLYLKYKANIQNLDFEYIGYYNIGDEGISELICFASEKMFDGFLPGFMELLNGFTETDSKAKSMVTELPPPPMHKTTK